MKMKKVLAATAVAALLVSTSAAAFAAGGVPGNLTRERPAMTDEQKAEMRQKTELTDEQKAEMQAQMNERLAQELADGRITQEQYDAMISGDMSGFGGRGHGFKGEKTELTEEQKAEMQAQMKEKLAQDLADGKITQEQYDAMISGDISGFGGRGHGFRGEKTELTDEQKANSNFPERSFKAP